MTKIRIGLILAVIATSPSYAALPTELPRTCVKAPSYHGGITFGIGLTYWQPISQNLDYALFFPQFDSTNQNAAILEDGEYKILDPEGAVDFIMNFGYVFPCSNSDIIVTFNNLNLEDKETFVNPTIGFNLFAAFPLGAILGATGSFNPGSNELTFFDPSYDFNGIGTVTNLTIPIPIQVARSRVTYRNHIWDAEFGQTLFIGCKTRCRFILGIRLVDLNEKFDCRYLGSGVAPAQTVTTPTGTTGLANFFADADLKINQSSEFDGAGPRLGFNFSYHLGNGFGLVAESSGSLLIGELNSSLREKIDYVVTGRGTSGPVAGQVFVNNTPEREIFSALPSESTITPNLDAKIALDYTYVVCYLFWSKVTAELGYRVNHYWNTVKRYTSPETIQFTAEDNLLVNSAPQIQDTSFAGPYFSLQIQL